MGGIVGASIKGADRLSLELIHKGEGSPAMTSAH